MPRGSDKERFRLAATSPTKSAVVRELLAIHPDDPTLIIGTYLEQIEQLSSDLDLPMITGATSVENGKSCMPLFAVAKYAVS